MHLKTKIQIDFKNKYQKYWTFSEFLNFAFNFAVNGNTCKAILKKKRKMFSTKFDISISNGRPFLPKYNIKIRRTSATSANYLFLKSEFLLSDASFGHGSVRRLMLKKKTRLISKPITPLVNNSVS